ncbi:MAG: SH3 domain-containing protein [Pseudomonadota bacterium]
MPKYIPVTCVFLFWAFYEMSGGADFKPPDRNVVLVETAKVTVENKEPISTISATQSPEPVSQVVMAAYEEEPLSIATVTTTSTIEAIASPAFVAPLPIDIRFVAGDWVNMRDGPSTDYQVLDTLPRGTQAEVLDVNGAGWAQIRLIESGKTGWMAERLLQAQ